jgi:hypothetical protein
VAATVRTAVNDVLDDTTTLLAVIPGGVMTVVPPFSGFVMKLVPVNVTVRVCPKVASAGFIKVSVGAGGLIVNVTSLLYPAAVKTPTWNAPTGAFAAIVSVAVIEEYVALTLLAVAYPAGRLIVVPPDTKLVPVKVTLTVCP